MENLGIVLPGEIQMLLAKKNSLLNDIMKVKNMVNTYNTFISSMSNLEVSFLKKIHLKRGLFYFLIKLINFCFIYFDLVNLKTILQLSI